MTAVAWDLLVDRHDLRRTQIMAAPLGDLAEGEVRLQVESFALTANNITYGAAGDSLGYWKFFPAPQGLGRIPVWGFARVVESRAPGIEAGLRLFGYWPMSTHLVARLEKTSRGFVDASAHRAELPPTYNAYVEAPADPMDDARALLRPLLMTSFLLDDQLSEAGLSGLVLSSGSSKTAMGLAWLARRRGVKVTGLTSPAHLALLEGLGLYDDVVAYADIAGLKATGPTVYVDFAGRSDVTAAVHSALGEALVQSLIVGVTHWESLGGPPQTIGPTPSFFFAPDRIRQRIKDWGPAALDSRFDAALRTFLAEASWLTLQTHVGADALSALYAQVVAGQVSPDSGHIVRPR